MLPRSHREIAFHKKLEQERKAAKEEPPARANGINWHLPFRRVSPCDRSRQKAPRSAYPKLA
jgi:hypothetical protein